LREIKYSECDVEGTRLKSEPNFGPEID